MQPARKARKSCLLDVPQPWLLRLFTGPYLDSDSKLNLFRTCSLLSKLALHHSNSTTLSLRLLSTPTLQAFKALQMASRHSHNINLRLLCGRYPKKSQRQESDTQAKLRLLRHAICSFLAGASEQGVTKSVTTLQLQGAYLKTLVPPIVGQACPHATKLVLKECCIVLDPKLDLSSDCPKLQSLELHDVTFHRQGPADAVVNNVDMYLQRLKADLSNLTATKSIVFNRSGLVHQDPLLENAPRQVFATMAGQLTHLCWDTTCIINDGMHPTIDWTQLGATLQHLQLRHVTLDDSAMKTFLKMPHLTHVQVKSLSLKESFAGQPCSWQQLTVGCANVLGLARLPLHSGLLLQVGSPASGQSHLFLDGPIDDEPTVSRQEAQQAVTNVQKCQGVRWGEQGVCICSGDHDEVITLPGLLDQVLLLLEGVTALKIVSGHLDATAMQALCKCVSNREGGMSLNFDSECDWDAGDMMCLIEKMPQGSVLKLHTHGDALGLITQLCCTVQA